MARVAEAECATCFHIRPKNEMRQVRVRRKSTSSVRTHWGLTRNSGRSVGTRDSFRHEMVFVCNGCKPPKSDGGFGFFFPAAIAVTVIGFLGAPILFGGAKTIGLAASTKAVASAVDHVTDSAPASDSDTAVDAPTPEEAAPAPAASEEATEETSVASTLGSISTESEPAQRFNFDVTEIANAEASAAASGSAERWSVGGQEGYSVASEPASMNGQECRNVYSTVDATGQKSSTRRFCHAANGDWIRV